MTKENLPLCEEAKSPSVSLITSCFYSSIEFVSVTELLATSLRMCVWNVARFHVANLAFTPLIPTSPRRAASRAVLGRAVSGQTRRCHSGSTWRKDFPCHATISKVHWPGIVSQVLFYVEHMSINDRHRACVVSWSVTLWEWLQRSGVGFGWLEGFGGRRGGVGWLRGLVVCFDISVAFDHAAC